MSARAEVRRLVTNPALVAGSVGVLALLAMGVFGVMLAPHDPNAGTNLVIRDLPNGNTDIKVPPTMPDPEHLFGTDVLGRDHWSRILAGARLTLSIVLTATVVRLAVGFTLGLLAGWYGGPFARGVRIVSAGITAIPQLILAIILVLVLQPRFRELGYIAALALVGWPDLVEFLYSEVRRVRSQPFIEAARSMGASPLRLLRTHVVAALAPRLLTLTALETGAVLLLLAELGLVGLFLAGSTSLVDDSGGVGTLKERAPEWGQMLGSIQFFAMQFQLSTLIPALFVVAASAIFALLADGLRAASDPYGERGVLPGTFGVISKTLIGAACFSAVGFLAVNIQPSVLTMEQGREIASQAAEKTWPGSQFVAGVVRFSSQSHGLDRPQRLTYYFRNERNEVLRIAFDGGDRLTIVVRPYETEDEIEFAALKPITSDVIGWDRPILAAESTMGSAFRRTNPSYLMRAIVTWPEDRDAPVYEVTYGTNNRGQLALRRTCCWDARTGARVDEEVAPPQELGSPWPAPADCPVTRTVLQRAGLPMQAFFVDGTEGLSVGALHNLYYQGDNYLILVPSRTDNLRIPRLESSRHHTDPSATVVLEGEQLVGNGPTGGPMGFATLQFSKSGCWTVRITMGTAALEYTLYVYPWGCRPAQERAFPPPRGATPEPCTRP